jgi:DNA sulfur modification protein DndC
MNWMFKIIMSKRINHIISELKDQYLIEDNLRPWIIGFSGGKDSTALLQLVWHAIRQVPDSDRKREVYVVCNDTLVENPVIQTYVDEVLHKIELAAVEQNLPIKVQKTIPRLEGSFWVNVIGRGYPVPNNTFRWCTERMKIKPTSRFILEQVAENGEAIILVGTRRSESVTRANSIKKHEIRGKHLTKHPHHPNTFVYSPIKELMLEEVWYIINSMTSPWGADNSKLFQIYFDASADDYECPTMVTDDKHSSCGQSRFGCWTCTVVKEDNFITYKIAR